MERILEVLGYLPNEWEANYNELEGNRTNEALYNAYLKILELEGYNEDLLKLANKDDISIKELKTPASEIKEMVKSIFETLGIDTSILTFNAELDGKDFENQSSYRLWHLLYAYEEDNSKTGNDTLHRLLNEKFDFSKEQAKIIGAITFSDEYGSLSTKAMRNIYPYIKEQKYSEACILAGYRHSKNSLTKEELAERPLKAKLDLLKKNSLRNPVVEKILNQMVNVVNTLIETENKKLIDNGLSPDFQFDEIRIELARELKKNASERAEMSLNINKAKAEHENIIKLLQTEFGVKNPTRNDIIRYKLYEELKPNAYKDLYTGEYISREKLFSKEYDIEHIIAKARLFDDSFSNKTLVPRQINIDKGNMTAHDYILSKFGEEKLAEYVERVEMMFRLKENPISKAKYQKLLKKNEDIGDGFIERDLRETQYIAKKAKEMLFGITRSVVSTTGAITDKLREDWGLVNVMKELNIDKYRQLGLTELLEMKDGNKKEVIKDWTKRNDHRHHAMDALTIAFTKHNHIQYLNYLNARKDVDHNMHKNVIAIEEKETTLTTDDKGAKKRKFNCPIPNFRQVAKEHLEAVLVSQKAKNKVVTRNINQIASKNGKLKKLELTPRGQLHKETIYGKIRQYVSKEEKVSGKFDENTILKVGNPKFRALLLRRLNENGGDAKRAFTGKNDLSKNPIYVDQAKTKTLPEIVKLVWLEEDYTIKKDINADNFKDYKNLDKIIDLGVKNILIDRLNQYKGNAKEAFTDLDKNPIWLNEKKGIAIKRVTISGIKNAEALHTKKDHFGKEILNEDNNPIPVDFVSTGNNHHVAIYQDEKGNLQENVISFYEAVARVNAGLPIIDVEYKQKEGWKFLFTMKQNEYFVFPNGDFNPSEIDLLDLKNYRIISPNLFRVQKLATKDYFFRHHMETNVEDNKYLKGIVWKREGLNGINGIIKVRLNHLGDIVKVGEEMDNNYRQDQNNISSVEEPTVGYGRNRIRIYNSFEEEAEDNYRYLASLTPEEHLANTKNLIDRIYSNKPNENPNKRINFN
ncbi:type II CRISPR RNA-guided endonuclease Cas9 [Pedobacter sp. ASV28]|uniref:type II CRISPR RNA-guided endonuclease Cas9 n=1 Tax=Pedobacter sp. ASV28 TaxID=2795123 RepID=UPI0018EBC825|nr:type II CRISPR RNA-guided endonuclease Cas9 [Pedobacter sp. ASV28]